jgi:exopolysaccharide biosynthesis polyprenyl glycosylphosphotransferase
MNRYLIIVAGPLVSRSKLFADELARQLGSSSAVSCHSLFPSDLSLSDARKVAKEEILRMITDIPGDYPIVYGDNTLALESMRSLASLRIYVDADRLDVTTETLRDFETDSQVKKKAGKKDSQKTSSLSDDVQRILNERNQRIENEVASSKQYANIVIGSDEQADEAVFSILKYIQRTDPRLATQKLSDEQRRQRVDEMLKQYATLSMQTRKAKIKRKLWTFVIKATLFFKRLMDIVISLVALILLSPLFAIVALLIKLTDGGPVFYVQTRIGKQGKAFPFPKFRSMVLNADKMKDNLLDQAERKGDVTFKMKKDPRVTSIGRFIRRFSIDELPQVWCVLKGDMSIVGPRPPVPREVALYTQEDRRRLEVTPGLTGIWQVSGRSDIGFKQQVELDVLYIESHGFWLDIMLILKTIPAVLTGKGAY